MNNVSGLSVAAQDKYRTVPLRQVTSAASMASPSSASTSPQSPRTHVPPSQQMPSPPLPARGRLISSALAGRPPPPTPTPPPDYCEFVWSLVRDVLTLLGLTENSPVYDGLLRELNKHARLYTGSFAIYTIDKIAAKCHNYQRAHADVVAAMVIQKYIRTLRAYNEFIRLRDPTLEARRALLSTLIMDEKAYVHKLSVIVSDYLRPLREHIQGKNRPRGQPALITLPELQTIFGNIDALLLLHTELLRDLDHLMRNGLLDVKAVNKLFVTTAPKLRQLYTVYISNFSRSFATLERLRDISNARNPSYTFESFLLNLQSNSRLPDVSLTTLFVVPFNQCSLYRRFLDEFSLVLSGRALSRAPSSSTRSPTAPPEIHPELKDAIYALSDTNDAIVAAMNPENNVEPIGKPSLFTLQRDLIFPDKSFLIYAPDRKVVEVGQVFVGPKRKQRQFFLLTDMLLLCSELINPGFGPWMTKRYRVKEMIWLKEARIVNDTSKEADRIILEFTPTTLSSADTQLKSEQLFSPVVTLTLTCANPHETKAFHATLIQTIQQRKRRSATFGGTIEEYLEKERHPSGMPAFVFKATQYLRSYLDTEGLFRQSASSSDINAAKQELKQTKQGQLGELDLSRYNPHVVASLLKTFLRELSDPIIPSHYFTNLIEISELPKTEHVAQLKKLIASLPRTRLTVLSHLFKFLHEVTQHAATNRMNSMSLSICFTPVLCWPHSSNSVGNTLQVPRLSNAIASLIENAPTIFL